MSSKKVDEKLGLWRQHVSKGALWSYFSFEVPLVFIWCLIVGGSYQLAWIGFFGSDLRGSFWLAIVFLVVTLVCYSKIEAIKKLQDPEESIFWQLPLTMAVMVIAGIASAIFTGILLSALYL